MSTLSITTTPGVYYALAYWLSCNLIIINSKLRNSIKKTVVVQALFLIILVTIMDASDGVVFLFIPFMILYLILIFLVIFINCNYSPKTAFYFAIRAFIIGEFTASFEWQIFYFIQEKMEAIPIFLLQIICLVLVHGVVYTILYQLEKKNKGLNANIEINHRELISVIVIGSAIFVVSNLSYVIGGSLFSSHFVNEIFIIRTLVDMGGVAILFAYHVQLGELNGRLEVEQLQTMLNMQNTNYKMLEQSIETVNQKYHDLKYQISCLKEEISKEEGLQYLEKLEREIKIYEAQNKTGNKVLDIILTNKMIFCQNHWIEFTCVADGEAISFIDEMDISALFGNILDNAIESVSKLEQKEKRLIHLTVAKQKGFLRIRSENCYDDTLIFENGLPLTTKKDKKYHGFGLKSIQSIVSKYDGSLTINVKDGWFEIRILVPLPEG